MNRKTHGYFAACVGGLVLGGSVFADSMLTVYENDFSTRRSSEPVASTNWVVAHYATHDVPLAVIVR